MRAASTAATGFSTSNLRDRSSAAAPELNHLKGSDRVKFLDRLANPDQRRTAAPPGGEEIFFDCGLPNRSRANRLQGSGRSPACRAWIDGRDRLGVRRAALFIVGFCYIRNPVPKGRTR